MAIQDNPFPTVIDGTIGTVLLTAEQSWRLCNLSKSSWYKARASGRIPLPIRIGGALRWRRQELLDWIEAGCPSLQKWENFPKTRKKRVLSNPIST